MTTQAQEKLQAGHDEIAKKNEYPAAFQKKLDDAHTAMLSVLNRTEAQKAEIRQKMRDRLLTLDAEIRELNAD